MPAPPAAIELIDLAVTYPGRWGRPAVPAVRGLTLTAPLGRVTAVLGPNGAGKTTAVETCEGYRRKATGTVRVLGVDPRTCGSVLRPKVGVMLQDGGVPGGATVTQVLGHAARLYAHPVDPAMLADRLGLGSTGRRPFRRMSGGEQQRVKLALALVGRPELVVLDEPTSGLDPHARHLAWDLIREVRAAGVSVVLTTHNMAEAEELADHVVIIDAGVCVAAGSPRELTGAGSRDVITFLGPAGLSLNALRAALPHGSRAAETGAGWYRVDAPADPSALAALSGWCVSQAVTISALSVHPPTLEDVFLSLTGRDVT